MDKCRKNATKTTMKYGEIHMYIVQFTFVLITEKEQSCRPKPGRRLTESSEKTRQGEGQWHQISLQQKINTNQEKIPIEVPLASTYNTVV
jgi:hypothetical protein